MDYTNIFEGIFLVRPNRFIALVDIDGREEVCHVKNTGRCRELLIPGTRVLLEQSDNPRRKTRYDLVTVYKGNLAINMDSAAPNKLAREYLQQLFPNPEVFKAEYKFGASRLDFYIEWQGEKILVEVKGCTLEQNGVALFPDAPTARGVKHVHELIAGRRQGYRALIIMIVQMRPVKYFTPNDATHPEFGAALRAAQTAGVEIIALDTVVERERLTVGRKVPVKL